MPEDKDGTLATLRDQFAMAALMGLYAAGGREYSELGNATIAYRVADEMLKAREEK